MIKIINEDSEILPLHVNSKRKDLVYVMNIMAKWWNGKVVEVE